MKFGADMNDEDVDVSFVEYPNRLEEHVGKDFITKHVRFNPAKSLRQGCNWYCNENIRWDVREEGPLKIILGPFDSVPQGLSCCKTLHLAPQHIFERYWKGNL